MMEIKAKAPAVARHAVLVNASSETIWQILTDIDRWHEWYPAVSQAHLEGLLKPNSIFRWKSGGTAIVSTLQEVEPESRLSWTGQALGTQAIHVWIFEPQENGVLVRSEESFDGWLVRLFSGMMQKMLDRSLLSWLEHLKQRAEAAPF